MEFALDVFHHTDQGLQGHLRVEGQGQNAPPAGFFNIHFTPEGASGLLLINPEQIRADQAQELLQKLHALIHQHTSRHMETCDVVELVQPPAENPGAPMPAGFNLGQTAKTATGQRIVLQEAGDNIPKDAPQAALFDFFQHESGQTHVTMVVFDPRFMTEPMARTLFNWLLQSVEGVSRERPIHVDIRTGRMIGQARLQHPQG